MQSKTTQGTMAEWLGIGLQNRAQQFDSAWYLKEGAVMRMHVWRLTFFLLRVWLNICYGMAAPDGNIC